MKEIFGISKSGNLKEAIQKIRDPQLLLLIVNEKEQFAEHVKGLEHAFPGVPSIGCVGQSYAGGQVLERGITVIGLSDGVTAQAGVLTHVSDMPMYDIWEFESNLGKVKGTPDQVVCIDFCSSNDECVITTMQSILRKRNISLTGGTAWEGLVSCNGKVYEDAAAYAFVKNHTGRVRVYKENLYRMTRRTHMVTRAIPKENIICELDGFPIETVYCKELGISPDKITTQTFCNPFGRCIGDEVYIISIKDRIPNKGISCYRKTNPKERISILELGNCERIVKETIAQMKEDFTHISGVISINCAFRYALFNQLNFTQQYFQMMQELGTHAGLVGLGEHYNAQFTNQTMSCVVFE